MTRFFRQFSGLGAAAALIGTLVVSGCGTAPRGLATAVRPATFSAKSAYSMKFEPRPKVRNLRAPITGTSMRGGLEADDEPDRVDELLTVLQNYGYNGNRKQMVRELQGKLFAYPVNTPETPFGWEPALDPGPEEHYKWWKQTLQNDVGSYNDYLTQSLQLSQNKFDVVYYVWISKQYSPQGNKPTGQAPWNNAAPFVDLNEGLPVVKAIAGGGWLVEISGKATILDYLKIPESYLKDLNHLVKVPEELYF